MASRTDRRQNPRSAFKSPMAYALASRQRFHGAQMTDCSKDGIQFISDLAIRPGAEVMVRTIDASSFKKTSEACRAKIVCATDASAGTFPGIRWGQGSPDTHESPPTKQTAPGNPFTRRLRNGHPPIPAESDLPDSDYPVTPVPKKPSITEKRPWPVTVSVKPRC